MDCFKHPDNSVNRAVFCFGSLSSPNAVFCIFPEKFIGFHQISVADAPAIVADFAEDGIDPDNHASVDNSVRVPFRLDFNGIADFIQKMV